MTRDDVIHMARETGYGWLMTNMHVPALERFAALVAEAEREACKAIAEKELGNTAMLTSLPPQSAAAWNILAAIRARGNSGP
jgi:hypothetical protein